MLVILRRFSKSLRNVGIIAHIDAGKTTTTERMLFNCGKIKIIGEVDKGTTMTDFLDQERERGISITSATATMNWKEHQINLIDTPGHVDFTLEVERSLAILDGAVTVLDGNKGVEAQTNTVWNQAKNYKIPNIFYINKFDRKTAKLNFCLKSIKNKLSNTLPLLINLPFYCRETGQFCGIANIVDLKLEYWDVMKKSHKDVFTESLIRKISDSEDLFKLCIEARQKLLEDLIDLDDGILREEFLTHENAAVLIPSKMIHESLRKVTISAKASSVIIGSSKMNIGVNNILDCIVLYLPNPLEKEMSSKFASLASKPDHLTALAFKVSHDKFKGPLTFLRIYSGLLMPGLLLKNLTRSNIEKVGKIIQFTGDSFIELDSASTGNIVAISGLKNCFTGDLLVDSNMPNITEDGSRYSDLINIPSPVIYASIEASGKSEVKILENALIELTKEDPSLTFHEDEESHQLIIGGMGKLHLEVVHDRIINDYKLHNTRLGKVKVAYKECPVIDSSVFHEYIINENVQGHSLKITIGFSAEACSDINTKSEVELVSSADMPLDKLDVKTVKLFVNSVFIALKNGGPLMRSPITGIKIKLHYILTEPHDVYILNKLPHTFLRSCVIEGTRALLRKISTKLLEPMMKVDISFNNIDSSTQFYVSNVMNDFNKRRSRVIGTYSLYNDAQIDHLAAFIPLSETENYSSILRSLSSGTATLHMSYSHYSLMSQDAEDNVTKKILYKSKFL